MNNLVLVTVSMPFGNEVIRPVNDTARMLTDLLQQKTFTREDISRIKALGFVVKTLGEEL